MSRGKLGRWVAVMAVVLGAASGAVAQENTMPDKAKEAERHYRAGVDLMRSEGWEEAAAEFKAATAADPDMVLAHYNLGQCRMAQKRYVEAVAAYRETKERYERLGHVSEKEMERRERDIQDEITGLRDTLSQLTSVLKDPNDIQRRSTEIEGRISMLESMRRKGGKQQQMPAEFPLALGSAYFRQQKLEEARAEYEEAVKLNPKLGPAHNNLAVIFLLTGHPEEAQQQLELARKSGFKVNPQLEADIKKARSQPRP